MWNFEFCYEWEIVVTTKNTIQTIDFVDRRNRAAASFTTCRGTIVPEEQYMAQYNSSRGMIKTCHDTTKKMDCQFHVNKKKTNLYIKKKFKRIFSTEPISLSSFFPATSATRTFAGALRSCAFRWLSLCRWLQNTSFLVTFK